MAMRRRPTQISSTRLRENAKWWETKKNQYPFHIVAPTTIKPHKVPGDHASAVLSEGFRTWGFKDYSEYQKFAELVTKVAQDVANV